MLFAAAYDGVVFYADEHKCWDLLTCPKFYYIGIMELTRWDHFPSIPNTTLAPSANFPGHSTHLQQPSLPHLPDLSLHTFPVLCILFSCHLPSTTAHSPPSNSWLPLPHPSGIVKNCEPVLLHRILNLAKNHLNSVDNRQKILARTLYAQVKAWGEDPALTIHFL